MIKYVLKNRLLFIASIMFLLIGSLLNILMAYLFRYIIDTAVLGNIDKLKKSIMLFFLFIFTELIADYLIPYFNSKFIKKSMLDLKKDIFLGYLKKNIVSFKKENSAKYISSLTNDINILENNYFNGILILMNKIFLFVFALIALIRINIYVTCCILIVGWIPVVISKLASKKIQNLKKFYSDNLGLFTCKIKDIFLGFEVIKSFNIENKIEDQYNRYNLIVENSKFNSNMFMGFINALCNFFTNSMFVLTLLIGTYFTIKGSMSVGTLIASVQLMNYIVNPILSAIQQYNNIKSVDLIYKKLQGYIRNEEVLNSNNYIEKNTFNDSIEFKNVSFGYNENNIIKNINLKIEKGKKYAIVGESGGGKSTLLKLLLRYYDNYEGDIYIDNLNYKNVSQSEWFKIMNVIHQDVFIFDGSIKDNVDLFQQYDNEKIDEAIKLSNLIDIINRLPNGKNSLVGENGTNLSGGEKQRIAIARALIKETPIIILDEATSSLDNKTAYNIEKTIFELKNITAIVVTHKLTKELLSKYDFIIVIKNGQIIEQGTFNELIGRKQYFYSLYYV